jgi:hypothetical protein
MLMRLVATALFLTVSSSAMAGGGIKNVHSAYLNGQTVTSEPGPFKMQFGDVVYVSDGSCPAGQIKQVTAPMSRGQPRTRQCVAH